MTQLWNSVVPEEFRQACEKNFDDVKIGSVLTALEGFFSPSPWKDGDVNNAERI